MPIEVRVPEEGLNQRPVTRWKLRSAFPRSGALVSSVPVAAVRG